MKGYECKKPQNFLMIAEEEVPTEFDGAPNEDPNEDGSDLQEYMVILVTMGIHEVQVGGRSL